MSNVLSTMIAGREMKVEFGKIGMLSNAAIFMSYGDTVILTNVNASEKPRDGIDFFPLSVEYEERLYSVGKIPGWIYKKRRKTNRWSNFKGKSYRQKLKTTIPKGIQK